MVLGAGGAGSGAAAGERRSNPGDVFSLDHGIELVALVVNARDIDGDTVDVHVPGRRDDCASNDGGRGGDLGSRSLGFAGIVEIQVWQRSHRVFIWRNGTAVTPGTRFLDKER